MDHIHLFIIPYICLHTIAKLFLQDEKGYWRDPTKEVQRDRDKETERDADKQKERDPDKETKKDSGSKKKKKRSKTTKIEDSPKSDSVIADPPHSTRATTTPSD